MPMSTTSASIAIGERVRGLRTDKGLTVRHVATAMDVSHTTLSRLERGVMEWTFPQVQRTAAVLGVDMHFLLTGDGPTLARSA